MVTPKIETANNMIIKEKLLDWLTHRLPPCKEITRMVSEAMDRKLPLRQRIQMRLHLMICAYCMRYFQQLQLMRETARLHSAQAENSDSSLSSEARERMKRTLYRPS